MGKSMKKDPIEKSSITIKKGSIEERVIGIVAERLGKNENENEITRDLSFTDDLHADSLDAVELIMEFEDEFDIRIPDEEAEKIKTVGHAIDYVNGAVAKKTLPTS